MKKKLIIFIAAILVVGLTGLMLYICFKPSEPKDYEGEAAECDTIAENKLREAKAEYIEKLGIDVEVDETTILVRNGWYYFSAPDVESERITDINVRKKVAEALANKESAHELRYFARQDEIREKTHRGLNSDSVSILTLVGTLVLAVLAIAFCICIALNYGQKWAMKPLVAVAVATFIFASCLSIKCATNKERAADRLDAAKQFVIDHFEPEATIADIQVMREDYAYYYAILVDPCETKPPRTLATNQDILGKHEIEDEDFIVNIDIAIAYGDLAQSTAKITLVLILIFSFLIVLSFISLYKLEKTKCRKKNAP